MNRWPAKEANMNQTVAERRSRRGNGTASLQVETFADLMKMLGNIPLHRVWLSPPPGTATEKDVLAVLEGPRKRLVELVDGVLVEKAMGLKESALAMVLGLPLEAFAAKHDLGFVTGADGAMRLMPGLVRIPDVSFIAWESVPGHEVPDEPIPDLFPDLAVEVFSKGNTAEEMARKVGEYFRVGVRMVWIIYPKTQTAEIYTSPTKVQKVGKTGALDGGSVVPGFRLPLKQLFARMKRKKTR
jgi:Uma2 family endonuclease